MNQPDMVLELLKAIAGHRHHPPPEPTRCAPTTEHAYRIISHRHPTGNMRRHPHDEADNR